MSPERNNEVSPEVAKECINRMILARTSLMLGHPFFGVLASRLRPTPNNTWCRTMAVDGKHLFYNVEFVMGIQDESKREEYEAKLRAAIPDITDAQVAEATNGLTDQNLVAVICHEILHCAYDHFLRRGNRDPKIWNVAADYAINQMLVRDKIGQICDNWLYDKKFDGMTAEEIYAKILEEAQQNQGDGDGDGEGDGDGDSQSQGGSGSGKGEFRGTFGGGGTVDQHDIPEEGQAKDENGNPVSGEKRREFMEDFKTAMMNAARAGDAPAEIQRMIKDFQEPKIDWRAKLARTLRSWMKSDSSFMTPSRRSWSSGFGSTGSFYGSPIFPGLKPDEDIDIAIALDASGSISTEMLKDFIGEVLGITKQFKQFKIRIMTFDTAVYTVKDYKTGDEKKILEYPIHGGGGTDFQAVWDHMKEDDYKPKQLIMFTDGEPWNSWGDPDYCKTLFVIHSNPKKESPFGETVHYEWEAQNSPARR